MTYLQPFDPGIIELRVNIDRDKIASYGISPTEAAHENEGYTNPGQGQW